VVFISLTWDELSDWYPVQEFYDASANELGHVPYTPVFFTALATAIARKFHALNRPPIKVVALDCDNTLWTGVCGEDGADGLRLEPCRIALHHFMRKQADAGVLLCAVSKNNEQDVREVFRCRKDMPLRSSDFAAWKLNWLPKSENLKALARELNLGLDSFVFVDDNPVECAEVEASCPGVRTLLLPEDPEQIPQFLKHCWVFDHLKLTAEDRSRAEKYRQNQEREKFREQSPSLSDFLGGLELQVDIEPMKADQLARVCQLTQRTNQFNCTTRRRSEADIQKLLDTAQILTISVRDRFGDYGLTGLVVYQLHKSALEVDSFLLSCRVLAAESSIACWPPRRNRLRARPRLGRRSFHLIRQEPAGPRFP
jgi:FkbH-like protein